MAPNNVIPVGGAGAKRRLGSNNVFHAEDTGAGNGSDIRTTDFPVINLDIIQEQLNAAKELARKGQKQGEVGKHKSPQIKRSINFMYDVLFVAEDLEEKVDSSIKAANSNELTVNDLLDLKNHVMKIKSLTKEEMLKNRMASKSVAGWRTVSNFENDNMFEDEDEETAERLTKRFKAAESKAMADFGRMRRGRGGRFSYRGRGGFNGGFNGASGSGGFRGGFVGQNGRTEEREERRQISYSNDKLATMSCFKCNKLGHLIKDCPMK